MPWLGGCLQHGTPSSDTEAMTVVHGAPRGASSLASGSTSHGKLCDRRRFLIVVSVGLTMLGLVGMSPAQAAVYMNRGPALKDVDVISPTLAWAVGYRTDATGDITTRTLRWNGSVWKVVPSPNPARHQNVLTSVSAYSASDVWAVGYTMRDDGTHDSLILHWNGSTWSRVPSPDPGAFHRYLYGVSAISASDVWAVGQYWTAKAGWLSHTMTLHWDGLKWTRVKSPNPKAGSYNVLNSVSARRAHDVWAVGAAGTNNPGSGPAEPLLLHWDGEGWTKAITPMPDSNASLSAVDMRTASDGWAVGNYGYYTQATVIVHWDGVSWTQVTGPTTAGLANNLFGVQVISASDAWAVGQFGTGALLAHWDGVTWTTVESPVPYAYDPLMGVGTSSGDDAWAVGMYLDAEDRKHELRLRWDGVDWSEM